jgi:hypothetical protein
VLKSWEGYGKNWMHFMYELDNLFRIVRVSDENSSVTKGFQFFKHIWTQDFFYNQYAPLKATSSLFKPFPTSFSIFLAFHDLFWAKMTLNWKALQLNSEMVARLAWYHHFTHIACAKNLRGLRQKLDALRVQTGQSLSKCKGFGRKLICYKRISIF